MLGCWLSLEGWNHIGGIRRVLWALGFWVAGSGFGVCGRHAGVYEVCCCKDFFCGVLKRPLKRFTKGLQSLFEVDGAHNDVIEYETTVAC